MSVFDAKRVQAAPIVVAMRDCEPRAAALPPISSRRMNAVLSREEVPGGWYANLELPPGEALRIVALTRASIDDRLARTCHRNADGLRIAEERNRPAAGADRVAYQHGSGQIAGLVDGGQKYGPSEIRFTSIEDSCRVPAGNAASQRAWSAGRLS